MKNTWGSPRIVVEQFAPNEYVATCWAVACEVDWANDYENNNYYNRRKQETWADIGCTHASDHCGSPSNQVIYDYNNDGTPDRMVEEGTDGLGNLTCTIYSDEYSSVLNVANVSAGMTIYWTTTVDPKVWHHKGVVQAATNRS